MFKLQQNRVNNAGTRRAWQDFKGFRAPASFATVEAAKEYAQTLNQDGEFNPNEWRVLPLVKPAK
jgi:hypothetical protein